MKKLLVTALCAAAIFASCANDEDAPQTTPIGITTEGKLEISNIVLFEDSGEQNSLTEKPLTTGAIEIAIDSGEPLASIPLSADGKASLDFAPYLSVEDLVPIRENFGFTSDVTISDETALVAHYTLNVVYLNANGTSVSTDLFLSTQRANTNVAVDGFFVSAILYSSKATQVKGTQVIDGQTIEVDANLRAGWNTIGGPVYFSQNRSVLSANNLPQNCRWIVYSLIEQ